MKFSKETLFFSKSAELENFTTGSNASDAMVYSIASNKVNAIRYLSAQRSLLVGTVGGEFVVSASGTTSPITPTNIQIQRLIFDIINSFSYDDFTRGCKLHLI